MAFHFTISNASIQDTLRYILNFVNKYSTDPFVTHFANEFHPSGDKKEFIKRIFDYICTNGYYKLDEDGEEEVWTPAKIIRTRNSEGKFQYDCKKISILIGSVLKAAGIEPILKHVYYSDGQGGYKGYTHIYIIVPMPDMDHYITIDPTNNCQWNTEVEHDKANLYFLNGTIQEAPPMNLHLMGNNNQNGNNPSILAMFGQSAGCVENDMNNIVGRSSHNYEADMIGLKNDYFSFTYAEGLAHVAAKGVLLIPRNAFLGLLYLGKLLANTSLKLNIASRLARAWQADKEKVRRKWWNLGGDADAKNFKKAIIAGSGISISGIISGPIGQGYDYPIDVVTPYLQEQRTSGIGIAPAVLAAITASAPVVLELLKMLKGMGIVKEGETDLPVDPNTIPAPTPPPPPPSAGSMFDFSSPVNTIVKSVFLMGISGMISGPSYYILNIFCAGAICFSFIKSFSR